MPGALSDEARERAARVARDLLEADPRLPATEPFGAGLRTGLDAGPCFFIEDHHGIRLFEKRGNLAYAYRALLLARPGDVVVVDGPRSPAFERYCAETLGLGEVEILEPAEPPAGDSLAARCARDPMVLERPAAHARRHGGLNVVPWPLTQVIFAAEHRRYCPGSSHPLMQMTGSTRATRRAREACSATSTTALTSL